ncbi:DNA replication/repair protein RecF [Ornithinimicrobium pratense]|uniref:DNA replication and repair protein RecF n=1 Tax=Ornithinimicrobium pratense TaxID=2593973 RepID=A0A5J6V271_9MICO|nr:DNA replication/repair protein RecF [Ornithinimicrobium pratense]QFG67326.1 DNA replication/repair protein RecF [Ornithinimicrobium pratense]
MHLSHLSLADFRSYPSAEVDLVPGVTVLLGRNGQGKTNLVEAAGYVATLASHRVAQDAPLVRAGAESAIVRATVVREGRESLVELEIVPGRANKTRLNRAPVARQREVLGTLRTVLFAPEDLALVKGDPAERRRLLDDLLVARQPRWAGVRADYDRAVRQRGALLKSAAHLWREPSRSGPRRGPGPRLPPGESLEEARSAALATLAVFDEQLAQIGGALLYARLRLLRDLRPYLAQAYRTISDSESPAEATYRSSLDPQSPVAQQVAAGEVPDQDEVVAAILASIEQVRRQEQERGVCLVGPHRDDLVLTLGELPAKGYASHGESWSLALSLRLAGFHLLRHDLGTDPVLVLDDVFAELDVGRRERLAELVADCEQVLVTAAVAEDVPARLLGADGRVLDVVLGSVTPRDAASPDGPGEVNGPEAPGRP